MTNEPNFEPAAKLLVGELQSLYKDWKGVNQLNGTVERLMEMYTLGCWSPEKIEKELGRVFKDFDDDCQEMIVAGPSSIWAICPHHLLPCEYLVTIGILPDGKVPGVSKYTRVADIMGHRPVMQETFTTELVDYIFKRLKPKGAAVHVVGSHTCMLSRGVKQPHSNTVDTTALRGLFLTSSSVKEEFMLAVSMKYRSMS
jgi:GTP cyclohydrolase I